MEVIKTVDNDVITIALEGRLDTMSAPYLESQLPALDSTDNIVFDLAKLEYISSAGLRVLLKVSKALNSHGGTMTITNASATILEIFEITGFSDLFIIK